MDIGEINQTLQPLRTPTAVLGAVVRVDKESLELEALFPQGQHLGNAVNHEICCNLAIREPQVMITGLGQQNAERCQRRLGLEVVVTSLLFLPTETIARERSYFYSSLGIQGDSQGLLVLICFFVDPMNLLEGVFVTLCGQVAPRSLHG